MSDITTRLRRWAISTDAAPASDLMDEAADRIESDAKQIGVLTEECQALKALCVNGASLTAEEREAIHRAEARLRTAYVPDDETAATLRKLLARLA
jgi:hypothetical protein